MYVFSLYFKYIERTKVIHEWFAIKIWEQYMTEERTSKVGSFTASTFNKKIANKTEDQEGNRT